MFKYSQSSGEFSQDGKVLGRGYSGFEQGKNNPAMQDIQAMGPIPRGMWEIHYPAHDSWSHGPVVMPLTPHKETAVFGRSGFLIHGDSFHNPGEASLGCIILSRPTREHINTSQDPVLEVTE